MSSTLFAFNGFIIAVWWTSVKAFNFAGFFFANHQFPSFSQRCYFANAKYWGSFSQIWSPHKICKLHTWIKNLTSIWYLCQKYLSFMLNLPSANEKGKSQLLFEKIISNWNCNVFHILNFWTCQVSWASLRKLGVILINWTLIKTWFKCFLNINNVIAINKYKSYKYDIQTTYWNPVQLIWTITAISRQDDSNTKQTAFSSNIYFWHFVDNIMLS